VAEARILWNLLLLHIWTGRPQAALEYGEQALTLARALDLSDLQAYLLHDLWLVYMSTDQVKQTEAVMQEGRERLRQLGNLPLLIENLGRSAMTYVAFGKYNEAIVLSDEAARLASLSNNIEGQSVARSLIGSAYLERGQIDQAIAAFGDALALGEVAQNVLPMIGSRAELGLLYACLGAYQRASELVHTAQEIAERRFPIMRGWAAAAHLELHLMESDLAEAEWAATSLDDYQLIRQQLGFVPAAWVRVALASARLALAQGQLDQALAVLDNLEADLLPRNLNLFLPDTFLLKSQALLAQSPPRLTEAFDVLISAGEVAEVIGSNFKLWQILAALADVERRQGRHLFAFNYQAQAYTIVQQIAGNISDPDLRTSFLNTPAVRKLEEAQTSI
jgi:tetratricopeptide (TPR) repeat protein